MRLRTLAAAACSLIALVAGAAAAQDRPTAPLKLLGRTELPGYTGDFDHFAVDLRGNRLFLAAEDHGTVEVFNLKTGAHETTLTGVVQTPHSIFYVPSKNRLIVTDSGDKMTKLLNATTYAPEGTLPLTVGADSIGYDASSGLLYVVTGGKDVNMQICYLEAVDPITLKTHGKLKFDSNHVEAMAVEQAGPYIFINVTDKNYLAVVDKKTLKVVKTWPIKEAKQNAPIAMDEAHHRLFVVTRDPGKIIVLNSDNGATVAVFPAPARVDEAVFDKAHQRAYVPGGQGYIATVQEKDPDHFTALPDVLSGPGAKTAILAPSLNELMVAQSPGDGKGGAYLLRYAIEAGR